MKQIKALWGFLSNLGVHSGLAYSKFKRVRILNRISVLVVLVISPYIFEYISMGAPVAAALQTLTVLLMASVLLLHRFKLYTLARFVALFSTSANIFVLSSIFGMESGEHLGLFAVAMVAFVIFDVEDRWALLFGVLICVLPIAFHGWGEEMFAPNHQMLDDPEATYMKNMVVTFVLLMMIALYFQSVSNSQLLDVITQGKKELETIFENAYDANFFIDENSLKIINANEQARNMFQSGEYRLEGRSIGEILGDKAFEIATEASHGEDKWSMEAELEVGEDKKLWTNMAFSKITVSRVPYILLRISDISDRKEAEQQLIKAKERAEDAARLKSQFLSTMSHELRTPMNAVIGMTSLILDTELNKEQRDFAETIRQSGDSLLNIINDILDFSQMQSGKFSLEKSDFSLHQCIRETMDILTPQAIDKKIELLYWVDPQTPDILLGDGNRLRQVLFNLLSNAIKFTHQGEVYLKVAWVYVQDGKHTLEFAVQDTGIGIPQEKLDHLFQKFSQVDGTDTRKHGGTGLGLAITSTLVKMMGGEIWVESEENVGSTFYFSLTLEKGDSSKIKLPSKAAFQLELKDGKAFVVDDNLTNLKIIQYQCKRMGMEVEVFDDPLKVIPHLKENSYDIGILDMQMPGMNGYQLASEIRKIYGKDKLPLILLSSVSEIYNPEIKEVFDEAMYKPARENVLFKKINRILHPQKVGQRRKLQKGKVGLPVPRVDQEKKKEEPKPSSSERMPNFDILLVEDNIVNQKVASRILKRMGFETDVAGNGLEALELMEKKSYDLIFMDVMMPEMDGITATREIRKKFGEQRPQPTIIALTANVLEEDKKRCFDAGMDDFLPKPVKKDQIKEKIEKWFETSSLPY